jgi:ClpP class serine protease
MFSVLAGLGVAGWSGIASIGVILGGTAAWQSNRRRKARPMAPGKGETAQYLDGGDEPPVQIPEEMSAWEVYKATIDKRVKNFAKARGSVVLKIVHHEVDEYVDTDTAIEAIDLIRNAPENTPIDVVLHTPGGIASATQQILHALKHHKGRKTAFVPYRAKSAGTMIALACDEIVMGTSAVLGPIDPQYAWMPAPILADLTRQKSADRISDEMMILSKMAQQAVNEARRFSCDYINDAHKRDGTCDLTNDLIGGGRNHDYPILPQEAAGFGLNISTDMPELAYGICQPPPKDDPVLIVSMFNTQKEEDGEAPSKPVFR